MIESSEAQDDQEQDPTIRHSRATVAVDLHRDASQVSRERHTITSNLEEILEALQEAWTEIVCWCSSSRKGWQALPDREGSSERKMAVHEGLG